MKRGIFLFVEDIKEAIKRIDIFSERSQGLAMDKEKNEIMSLLKKYISKVSKLIRLERVILFGSRARGDYGPRSDIDLILISKDFEKVRSFERSPKLYMLWGDNYDKYEIDIICLHEEFEIMKNRIGVIADAVKDGIEIK